MEDYPGQESGNESQPDVSDLGKQLDPSFCQDVFGRQISLAELDSNYYTLDLDELGLDIDEVMEKIDAYESWKILLIDGRALQMKMAVAMCQSDDGKTIQVLFLRQEARR